MNRLPFRGASQPAAWAMAFPFSETLSPSGAALLRDAVEPKTFPAGTVLLTEGETCEAALLVRKGKIRVYKTSPSGREITLYVVEPGEMCVLGISCLLRDTRYPACASAESETLTVRIPAPAFRRLFREEPAVQQFVLDLFASRLSSVIRLVEDVAFRRMDERLSVFLLQESGRAAGISPVVSLSHEQIATRLGTAREVVSRLLSQLEDDGLVVLGRGRVRILDPQGLGRKSCTPVPILPSALRKT